VDLDTSTFLFSECHELDEMPSRSDKYHWLPSCGILILGVLFSAHPWVHWWSPPELLADIIHGLGEALIIAGALGLTVDGYLKRHLINDIARDVFVHIFGHTVPLEMRERIDQLVRVEKIYQDFRVRYRLMSLDDGRVRVEVSQEYSLENLSWQTLYHVPSVVLEKQDSPELLEFKSDPIEDSKARFCYSERLRVEVMDAIKESGALQARAKIVRLRPNVKHPISVHYALTLPGEWSDIICFALPTINVSISIEGSEDFIFEVGPRRKDLVESRNYWRFPGAFVTGETLRVRWKKVPHSLP
jgi:hypothetical protein